MKIKVVSLQLNAYNVGQSDLGLENALMMIDKAALDKPDLVVLPECSFPGYILGLYEDIEEQVKKSTAALELFREKARKYSFYLVVGLVENIDERIVNTGVLIGSQGEIVDRAVKSFLWHFDKKWFTSGDSFEVFNTSFGRVGIIVCADGRQPEISRILSLKGAELIIDLTNLVTSGNQPDKLSNQQCDFMLPTRAIENRVWMIVANKVGIEANSVVYCG
ncbi:MAG: carbon-nitrogen hydrolase family protein, partial [Peptococcales bacterium]